MDTNYKHQKVHEDSKTVNIKERKVTLRVTAQVVTRIVMCFPESIRKNGCDVLLPAFAKEVGVFDRSHYLRLIYLRI